MAHFISIIIPNRNASATIGKCLEAAFSTGHENFEVVVVDDCSDDNSVELIKKFPCKLIRLEKHSGASQARNVGARNSKGDIYFFTDADCLIGKNALARVNASLSEKGRDFVVGGTYTRIPYDEGFFSVFQSVFVNYSETKKCETPDYVATHAMAINAEAFRKTGGFSENFLPILEDVEFSHRLRKAGYKLFINPELQVRHIFNYSFFKSMRNAARKTLYWTMYSIMNRDLLADSGTASIELKVNGTSFLAMILLTALGLLFREPAFLMPVPALFIFNVAVNKRLLMAFYEAKGLVFTIFAGLYYTLLYPAAVWAGAAAGAVTYLRNSSFRRGHA